jgi:hypothetical protein
LGSSRLLASTGPSRCVLSTCRYSADTLASFFVNWIGPVFSQLGIHPTLIEPQVGRLALAGCGAASADAATVPVFGSASAVFQPIFGYGVGRVNESNTRGMGRNGAGSKTISTALFPAYCVSRNPDCSVAAPRASCLWRLVARRYSQQCVDYSARYQRRRDLLETSISPLSFRRVALLVFQFN